MAADPTLSPVEVLRDVVRAHVGPDVVEHVVVGPLNHTQQQQGGVSLMDAGETRPEDQHVVYPRTQLRVMGPSLDATERIARAVAFTLNGISGRTTGVQGSTGKSYLVHEITVNGGPSAHQDTPETWEYLVFIESMIGTTPIA